MIAVNQNTDLIVMSRLKRCLEDKYNDYYLILQNIYTKTMWLFEVKQCVGSEYNPLRYNIGISFPECFADGTYNYYLTLANDIKEGDINDDYPADSQFVTKKEAIAADGRYIVIDGRVLVTSYFKVKLLVDGKELVDTENLLPIVSRSQVDDGQAVGPIVKEFTVLNTGLLKYYTETAFCHDNFTEYDPGKKMYTQYGG